jgi:hypothetical protein
MRLQLCTSCAAVSSVTAVKQTLQCLITLATAVAVAVALVTFVLLTTSLVRNAAAAYVACVLAASTQLPHLCLCVCVQCALTLPQNYTLRHYCIALHARAG